MQITREELNPCTVKLTIVCNPEQVKSGFDKAYKAFSKNMKVPGFRPGHVPRNIVEKSVDKNSLYEVAADEIVKKVFREALQQESLSPASTPSIELTQIDEEEAKCEFQAKVPLPPVVTLAEYKGVHAQQPPLVVTDEEVEFQVTEIRKKSATREEVTGRGVHEGDYVVVNLKASGDDGDGKTFMAVAGQTFPQLDQALSGMNAEEVKLLDLTFPENFRDSEWAGKTQKCQVTVRSLHTAALPDLTDEFAQTMNMDNVEALKGKIRELLTSAKENMAAEYVNEQILDALIQGSTIHVPDTMWEQVASRRLQELHEEQQKKGRSVEIYAKEQGMSIDELVESWSKEAQMHVIRAVAIQEIFTKEKMQLTNADLELELFGMAREYEVTPEQMMDILKKNQAIDELRFRAVFRKVTGFLRENANLTELIPENSDKVAAPKKARKTKKD